MQVSLADRHGKGVSISARCMFVSVQRMVGRARAAPAMGIVRTVDSGYKAARGALGDAGRSDRGAWILLTSAFVAVRDSKVAVRALRGARDPAA